MPAVRGPPHRRRDPDRIGADGDPVRRGGRGGPTGHPHPVEGSGRRTTPVGRDRPRRGHGCGGARRPERRHLWREPGGVRGGSGGPRCRGERGFLGAGADGGEPPPGSVDGPDGRTSRRQGGPGTRPTDRRGVRDTGTGTVGTRRVPGPRPPTSPCGATRRSGAVPPAPDDQRGGGGTSLLGL